MPNFILPSLSRAPSFKTQRKLGQGRVLADPMESGYVATRPRFTRSRRVFTVTYDLLTAEDVRALDRFETDVVDEGAGAFYLPNLLQNGSFESPNGTDAGVLGWEPGDPTLVGTSSVASDGAVAMLFSGTTTLTADCSVPFAAGDVLQVNAQVKGGSVTAQLQVVYADDSTATLQAALVGGAGVYAMGSAAFAMAASSTGATCGVVQLILAGTAGVAVDEVGLAQVKAAQPYGRMPGSASPASAVRLTGKDGMSFGDAKWAGGQKVYSATFEVTEV